MNKQQCRAPDGSAEKYTGNRGVNNNKGIFKAACETGLLWWTQNIKVKGDGTLYENREPCSTVSY